MSEDEKMKKRRRTPEELRAHYQEKMKALDEYEKRDVIRLISGAHDDLVKVTSYKCAPQPETNQIIAALKNSLKKLGV